MGADWRPFARAVSRVFGWIYVLSWSLSFYPQPVLNIRRRNTSGLAVDFSLLNVLGFVSYTTSTATFLFNTTVRRQYAARYPLSPEPTVRMNDFAFALHALVMCLLIYSQFWPRLWGFSVVKGQRASRASKGVALGCIAGVGITAIIVFAHGKAHPAVGDWLAIDVIYAVSYVKLLVTVIKYMPQVWHNYKAQSTEGWAIEGMLLDLLGGVLSISQLVIDSAMQADWSGITGNPVKLGLGNVSIAFDIIFIVQHYILYRHNRLRNPETGKAVDIDTEESSLLDGERAR